MRIDIGEQRSKLLEVYVTDFGDNYHRFDNEPTTELERAVRKIRRRYKNISDYMDALALYKEYMALLAIKYGGPQLFKIRLQDGMITDFIPSKPRMKNTANNKFLLKNKILVSKINVKRIDEEKLEKVEEALEETVPANVDAIISDTKTRDYIANRIMKEEDLTKTRINKVKAISSIEYLEEYFRNKNANKLKEKEEKVKSLSLTKIANGDYEDLVEDTTEDDDVIFYRGNYMKRDTVEDLRVYQDLGERGWNSVKLMRDKGVSKRITKIVKNQNKRNKKKNKKDKKKKKRADDFLVSVMMDNDHDSFADFEQDMLDFTARNIFK